MLLYVDPVPMYALRSFDMEPRADAVPFASGGTVTGGRVRAIRLIPARAVHAAGMAAAVPLGGPGPPKTEYLVLSEFVSEYGVSLALSNRFQS